MEWNGDQDMHARSTSKLGKNPSTLAASAPCVLLAVPGHARGARDATPDSRVAFATRALSVSNLRLVGSMATQSGSDQRLDKAWRDGGSNRVERQIDVRQPRGSLKAGDTKAVDPPSQLKPIYPSSSTFSPSRLLHLPTLSQLLDPSTGRSVA